MVAYHQSTVAEKITPISPSIACNARHFTGSVTAINDATGSISDRFRGAFQFFWSDGGETRPPIEEVTPLLFSMKHSTANRALVLDFDQRHLSSFNPKNTGFTPFGLIKNSDLTNHLAIASRGCPTASNFRNELKKEGTTV